MRNTRHQPDRPARRRKLTTVATSLTLTALAGTTTGCATSIPASAPGSTTSAGPTASSSTTTSGHPGASKTAWSSIHGRTGSHTLTIDVDQVTTDTTSPCYQPYTAAVTRQDPSSLTVRLQAIGTTPSCLGGAVSGAPRVPVALPQPYQGQRLIDAATGLTHPLQP